MGGGGVASGWSDGGRGLKWLAQSYAEAGMVRDATRVERDSQWWLNYSISLAHTPPHDHT